MVQDNRGNNVNNNGNNRRFNPIDVRKKYQPIFIHENEVTEAHINNRMSKYVNEYKNVFNNDINNNATTHKRRLKPVTNQFPERDTLGVSKPSKNVIPGYTISKMKQFILVGKHMR